MSCKHLEMMRHLLRYGASPNKCCKKSISPLMYAIEWDYEVGIVLLVQKGADLSYRDGSGRTAFLYLFAEDEWELANPEGNKNILLAPPHWGRLSKETKQLILAKKTESIHTMLDPYEMCTSEIYIESSASWTAVFLESPHTRFELLNTPNNVSPSSDAVTLIHPTMLFLNWERLDSSGYFVNISHPLGLVDLTIAASILKDESTFLMDGAVVTYITFHKRGRVKQLVKSIIYDSMYKITRHLEIETGSVPGDCN